MAQRRLYLSFDVGTSGVKGSIVAITFSPENEAENIIEIIDSRKADYPLYIGENGVMEQDAEEIFDAISGISRQVIADTHTDPKDISAIAFCGCLIGSVPVDEDGKPLCRAFSFLDYRGKVIHDREMKKPFTYQGIRLPALVRGLRVALSAPASSKDFIWRIKWLEAYAPELQSRLCKWLNYKEYFILRATGRMVMTEDTAFSTFLFDSREGRKCFDKRLCKAYGIDPSIFPEVIRSTDVVGALTEKAAMEMGLCPGISVVAGGNDTNVVPIGAGTVIPGDVNIYTGTCGWVSTVTKKRTCDLMHFMTAMTGVQPDSLNMYGQMETAGRAFRFGRQLLFGDESDRGLMLKAIERAPAGSSGVIFAPWLAGSRAPFSDDRIGAMFYNIKADTTRDMLARSVLEGIGYQLRQLLECQEKALGEKGRNIRLCGGGAAADLSCQIYADILGRTVEVPYLPQDSGVVGLSCLSAIALGQLRGFSDIAKLVRAEKTFVPDMKKHELYNEMYKAFTMLYESNKKPLHILNGGKGNG